MESCSFLDASPQHKPGSAGSEAVAGGLQSQCEAPHQGQLDYQVCFLEYHTCEACHGRGLCDDLQSSVINVKHNNRLQRLVSFQGWAKRAADCPEW